MAPTTALRPAPSSATAAAGPDATHFDVLIIGAGLSGIGAAWHLQKELPNKTYAILEARHAIGGTWDLFRYPGIRSDSDMYTLGYSFRPWTEPKVIADGQDIREYVQATAREGNIERHIRFGTKALTAAWNTETATWTLETESADGPKTYTASFLMACSGYYNYDAGYTPDFIGKDDYKGRLVHPQFWPENLDVSGKKVVVIGSGATAVTLVPALAAQGAQVTMLQRSPTYVAAVPGTDKLAVKLREYLPEKLVYRLGRTRNVGFQMMFYNLAKKQPKMIRKLLLGRAKAMLGEGYDMTHFEPTYNPWDERLCAVPSGDLFRAIRKGTAKVVTDHIERFTAGGVKLKSGAELDADIVVTATGLDLKIMGGVTLTVDGQPFEVPKALNYKGLMFEGLPNLVMVFGYTNASWTLKADLVSEYVCRLLKHLDKKGLRQATPRNTDPSVGPTPFVAMQSGYIQRAVAAGKMPQQGNKAPWKLFENYALDMAQLRFGRLEDGVMQFTNPKTKGARKAA